MAGTEKEMGMAKLYKVSTEGSNYLRLQVNLARQETLNLKKQAVQQEENALQLERDQLSSALMAEAGIPAEEKDEWVFNAASGEYVSKAMIAAMQRQASGMPAEKKSPSKAPSKKARKKA